MKELRGTESTRKSIQSLRQNPQGTVTSMLITAKQPTAPAVNNQLLQQFDTQQQQQQQQQGGDLKLANSKILLTLAISYRGVEFLDINTKVQKEKQTNNSDNQDFNNFLVFCFCFSSIFFDFSFCFFFGYKRRRFVNMRYRI